MRKEEGEEAKHNCEWQTECHTSLRKVSLSVSNKRKRNVKASGRGKAEMSSN